MGETIIMFVISYTYYSNSFLLSKFWKTIYNNEQLTLFKYIYIYYFYNSKTTLNEY